MDGVDGAGWSVRFAASLFAMEWIKWHVPYEKGALGTELVELCCKVRVVSVVCCVRLLHTRQLRRSLSK
jgi:hypothetical protein